jgi:hypothetical protein
LKLFQEAGLSMFVLFCVSLSFYLLNIFASRGQGILLQAFLPEKIFPFPITG